MLSCYYRIGIQIDAGSSGTRLFIYTWPTRSEPDTLPLVRCAPYHKVLASPSLSFTDTHTWSVL